VTASVPALPELVVTQRRLVCFKLGLKMGHHEFVTEFLERGLFGFYLSVVREGEVAAGDPIAELARDPRAFRVTEIARLYTSGRDDVEGMRRAADLDVPAHLLKGRQAVRGRWRLRERGVRRG